MGLPSTKGEFANSAVAIGCSARLTRNLRTMSASDAKSRFTCTVQVRSIMSSPRLPDLGHVAAHDPVAALGHPRDLVAPPLGLEAHAQHADRQRLGDLLHLVEVGVHLAAGLVQRLQRRAAELELAAGLEADVAAVLGQRDRVAVLQHRLPAEAGRQALEQRPDAARAVIGQRPEVVAGEAELLVLGADPPGRARLAALRQILDQLALAVIGSPLPLGGADIESFRGPRLALGRGAALIPRPPPPATRLPQSGLSPECGPRRRTVPDAPAPAPCRARAPRASHRRSRYRDSARRGRTGG